MPKPHGVAVDITDIVASYYWGVAENNPLGEVVISDGDVLKRHVLELLRPVKGIEPLRDVLRQGNLLTALVDLYLPTEVARSLMQKTVYDLMQRCLLVLQEYPLASNWGSSYHAVDTQHILVFYGVSGNDSNTIEDDRSSRSVVGHRQTWAPSGRSSNVGRSVYEDMLQSMGNQAIQRKRMAFRLNQFNQRLRLSEEHDGQGAGDTSIARDWPFNE